MQISKVVNLGHRSKPKNRPQLHCIREQDFKEISDSISPLHNPDNYNHKSTRQNSHENHKQRNITSHIDYNIKIRDECLGGGYAGDQEQVIIINNRKFIKSKSPRKDHSQSKPTLQINQPKIQPPTTQSIKLKILQKRISQLHQQKQNQYIQLLNQNKRLEKELELEKGRSKNCMKDSLMTPIKKISDNEDLYFSQHEIRIGSMKKRIVDLENALEVAKNQKEDSFKLAVGPSHQNGMTKRTSKPFESIVNQRQHVEKSQNLQKVIEQLQKQRNSFKSNINNLSSQISTLKFQNVMKTDLVLQKQHQIENLTQKNMQSQILISKLKRQNQDLAQNIQKLEVELRDLKNNINSAKQYKIPIKYAESESIDPFSICDEKLKDISVGCSVLIKQSSHPQKQQNLPHIIRKSSSYQSSIVQQFEEMNIDSELNFDFDEQSMCNIFEKIQKLNETNDRILIENKELGSKVLQLTLANQKLQDTLQQIYQNLHRRQLEIEGLREENETIRRSLKQLQIVNESALKTKISQKLIELQYSQSDKWYRKSCEKCQELIRLITKISSEAQKLDMGNSTF